MSLPLFTETTLIMTRSSVDYSEFVSPILATLMKPIASAMPLFCTILIYRFNPKGNATNPTMV